MTLALAIEKRLEREIARALEIMGHVRDRPEGLNEADTKADFIDPILSALGWELRDPVTGHRNRSANCRRALVELDSRSYWRVPAGSHWRRVVVALNINGRKQLAVRLRRPVLQ
jgi:hypothetical protein